MKIRPEMTNHPLAQAARETNEYAETHSLGDTCWKYGLKVEDLHYMADQRALRALAAHYGRNLKPNRPLTMQLSKNEINLMALLTSAYMDGLLIGWRAKEIEDGTDHAI